MARISGWVEQAKTLQWVSDQRGAYLRSERKSEILGFVKTIDVPDDILVGYEYVENKDPISNNVTERFWRTYNREANAALKKRQQACFLARRFPSS